MVISAPTVASVFMSGRGWLGGGSSGGGGALDLPILDDDLPILDEAHEVEYFPLDAGVLGRLRVGDHGAHQHQQTECRDGTQGDRD